MNNLKTTALGGFPFQLDDLRWINDGIREAFRGLIDLYGVSATNTFILSGCEVSGTTVNPGFVAFGGEIMYYPGGSIAGYTIPYWDVNVTYDGAGTKVFSDASTHETYEVRRAVLSNAPSIGAVPAGYTTLSSTKRLTELQRLSLRIGEWVNISSAGTDLGAQQGRAFLDLDGFVRMKGQSIFEDDAATASRLIGILPSGYRPVEAVVFNAAVFAGSLRVLKGSIATNGEIRLFNTPTGTLEVNFSDLPSFRVL